MAGISTLGQALTQSKILRDQQKLLSSLSVQMATGKKTQVFSGLKTQAVTSMRSRADFASLDNYITNITNAERRIKLMLTAVEEFQAQTRDFANFLVGFSEESKHQNGNIVYYNNPLTPSTEEVAIGMDSGDPSTDMKAITNFAGQIFNLFDALLNEKDGDRYVFSGAETLTRPLNNTGTLEAAMNSLVKDWKSGALSTDDLLSSLRGNDHALSDTVIGYSSTLSAGKTKDIFVRADNNMELNYTTLANDDAFRDIYVAAAFLMNANLPPLADVVDPETGTVITEGAPGANLQEMKESFFTIFNDLKKMVNTALDDIDQIRFKLESTRAQMDKIKTSHLNQKNVLLNTISNVENVDENEVALSINSLAIQLDASYRVTSRLQQLSLVNFI